MQIRFDATMRIFNGFLCSMSAENEKESEILLEEKSHLLNELPSSSPSSLDHITKFSTPQFFRRKRVL
jgi:hypothetical protein